MKRLLTGLQPSGNLTIGNYAGSINQIVQYQSEYDSFLFVADMHSITVQQDPATLRRRVKEIVGLYLASGVDPSKNTIYVQSENPYHANLAWIFECHTYFGELSRMHQFKEKSAKNESFSCGLVSYPALMAADILLYDADIVPTGIDQKQHVELARDLAIRMNNRYGSCFTVPEPLIAKVGARIKDLLEPTKKMSKSAENPKSAIYLLDDIALARSKIMGAKTDSESVAAFDEENRAGVSNLITIYSVFKGIDLAAAISALEGKQYGALKREVADAVCGRLEEIQARFKEVMGSGLVDDVLDSGRQKTTEIAAKKYDQIRRLVGLGR